MPLPASLASCSSPERQRAAISRYSCSPTMPLQEGACQEVGAWVVRIMGWMVLLCLTTNAISLLRRPLRGSRRRAGRHHAPQGERPPQASCCCAARRQKPPARPSSPPPPRSSDRSSAWLAAVVSSPPGPPLLPLARPARLLVCSVRREAAGGGTAGRAALGQVIYDARRTPLSRARKSPAWLQ